MQVLSSRHAIDCKEFLLNTLEGNLMHVCSLTWRCAEVTHKELWLGFSLQRSPVIKHFGGDLACLPLRAGAQYVIHGLTT